MSCARDASWGYFRENQKREIQECRAGAAKPPGAAPAKGQTADQVAEIEAGHPAVMKPPQRQRALEQHQVVFQPQNDCFQLILRLIDLQQGEQTPAVGTVAPQVASHSNFGRLPSCENMI